ncbi:MAG: BTAD domain-containing putative transcriptional regulator [Longimicrobiales bacterium]
MIRLRLELLGPPRLVDPSGDVVLSGGIPLAVLTYLHLEDRSFSRDHLSELFWPGADRRRRRHSLRQVVLRIRNSAFEELIQGNGILSLADGALRSDVSEFMEKVSAGQAREALALWRGPFLDGFRRPGSWELEDWIDRRRSFLEDALFGACRTSAREFLTAGAPGEALTLLEAARQALPFSDELGALEVRALAGAGRVAEASALLKRLELQGEFDGAVAAREAVAAAEIETALKVENPRPQEDPAADGEDAARPVGAVRPPVDPAVAASEGPESPVPTPEVRGEAGSMTSPASSSESDSPDPAGFPFRLRPWIPILAVASAILLLFLAVVRRDSVEAAILDSDAAGFALLTCASWATDGFYQTYRMGFDGSHKHRLSDAHLCGSVWVEEVEALFGVVPNTGDTARLVRLTPPMDNPIAEWDLDEVEAAVDLRRPWISRANPKVGRDGALVFWAADTSGNHDIYGLETATGEMRRLTDSPAVDEWPTLAPGTDRVIFTSYRSGGGDLYSVRLDGTELHRLTRDPRRDHQAWIRGDSVLFVRGLGVGVENGNMELILLDLSTGSETRLTDNDWNDFEPAWSPDGRYICWQSERLGHYESDVMVMDMETGRSWNATGFPGRESDCRWTPRGNGLIYMGWREGGDPEIYLQDMEGEEPVNLTRYPGTETVMEAFPLPELMR